VNVTVARAGYLLQVAVTPGAVAARATNASFSQVSAAQLQCC
jgi:hypothetical protein